MADYKQNVKEKIKQFSDYLGQKTWFTGDEVPTLVYTDTQQQQGGLATSGIARLQTVVWMN